jgi:hypothetical protein
MIQQDLITKTLAVFSPKAAMTRMADQARLRNFGRFDSALDSTKRGISRNISWSGRHRRHSGTIQAHPRCP